MLSQAIKLRQGIKQTSAEVPHKVEPDQGTCMDEVWRKKLKDSAVDAAADFIEDVTVNRAEFAALARG